MLAWKALDPSESSALVTLLPMQGTAPTTLHRQKNLWPEAPVFWGHDDRANRYTFYFHTGNVLSTEPWIGEVDVTRDGQKSRPSLRRTLDSARRLAVAAGWEIP
jgi:hypothetical protein